MSMDKTGGFTSFGSSLNRAADKMAHIGTSADSVKTKIGKIIRPYYDPVSNPQYIYWIYVDDKGSGIEGEFGPILLKTPTDANLEKGLVENFVGRYVEITYQGASITRGEAVVIGSRRIEPNAVRLGMTVDQKRYLHFVPGSGSIT